MNIHDRKRNFLYKRDGTGQQDRLLEALTHNNRLIDNKSLDEHIVFIYLYSDLLQYYNNDNEAVDYNAWRTFLEYDDTVIASLILHTNIKKLKEPISNAFWALKGNTSIHPENKYTKQLINILKELILLLNYWYERLSNNNTIKLEIYSVINHEINHLTTLLYNLLKHWESQTNTEPFTNFYTFLEEVWTQIEPWNQSTIHTDPMLQDIPVAEQIHNTLSDLFGILFNHIINLQRLARTTYHATLHNERHKPQIALIVTCLRLLEYATAHLNHIPQRHLDYYYKEVLKFREKPVYPDKVYVHFQLKNNAPTYNLPQGTQLVAGKTPDGQDIIFETDKTITLNQGTISIIHTFQRSIKANHTQDNLPVVNVDMTTYAMEDLYKKKAKLNLFTKYSTELALSQQTTTGQPLGLLITSDTLYLQEGKREITLTFKLTEQAFEELSQRAQHIIQQPKEMLYEHLAALFNAAITLEFTADEGWIALPPNTTKFTINPDTRSLKMVLHLMPDIPALVKFDSTIHGNIGTITAPGIRLIARDDMHIAHLYLFRELSLEKLNIQVKVSDYRGLILQNDLGLIDSSQPFQPFGPFPRLHANFYIGSDEIFCKNLEDLKLNIVWENLPDVEGGFKTYYQAYPHRVNNKEFLVNVSYLKHRQWQPFYPENRQQIPLFETESTEDNTTEQLKSKRIIDNLDKDILGFTPDKFILNPPILSPKTLTGFLKLELCGPEMAFGHDLYPKLLAQSFAQKAYNSLQSNTEKVNEPYTPTIKSLTVDYTAQDEIIFTKQPTHSIKEHGLGYIKLFPFGYRKEFPNSYLNKVTFLPDTDHGEHFLSLGIKNFNASLLRLHIEVDETSIDPDKVFIKPTWRCLSNNVWIDFTDKDIISDTTKGLTKSGIIVLKVPPTINDTNTLMAAGLTWIKAMFPAHIDTLPTILGIYTQAVSATRKIDHGNQSHKQPTKVSAYSIQNIVGTPAAIQAVTQPFPSFGGKPAENKTKLYTRVSERLRHKNRAISVWDYERMVLEQFPEVLKVKCINHSQKNNTLLHQPGHVKLVIIKAHKHKHSHKRLLPIASKQLLDSIQQYLQSVTSPFVKIDIINPLYEEIQVNLEVKFKPGYEKGVLLNRLQRDLKHFLSPWLLNKAEEVTLGGTIPSSKIMDFISQKAYIAAIGNFSILKYTNQEDGINITKITDYNNYLMATYPWSVMVSSDKHKISVVEEIDAASNFRHGGVNDMRIESDFIVGPWQTAPSKIREQEVQEEPLKESLEPYYLVTKKFIKH